MEKMLRTLFMEGPFVNSSSKEGTEDEGALEEPILISLDANILTLLMKGSSSKSSEILFGPEVFSEFVAVGRNEGIEVRGHS